MFLSAACGRSVMDVIGGFTKQSDDDRHRSWELCHGEFVRYIQRRPSPQDCRVLSLYLMGYLASWGMYRGSSKLLTDYHFLIHEDLIERLFTQPYCTLFIADPVTNTAAFTDTLNRAYDMINGYYRERSNGAFCPSQTLVTKILLGVYGCIPAYDVNVYKALRHYHIRSGSFRFLTDALVQDNAFVAECHMVQQQYPQFTFMKVVDMFLWEIGHRLHKEENEKRGR